MKVTVGSQYPDGFVVKWFAGSGQRDDLRAKEYVLDRLGLGPRLPSLSSKRTHRSAAEVEAEAKTETERIKESRETARFVWRKGDARDPKRIVRTYLKARGLDEVLAATQRYLPASDKHPHPAMMTAVAAPREENGRLLAPETDKVMAVQLTKLAADGSRKAGCEPNKILKGRRYDDEPPFPIVLSAIAGSDELGIAEGIEEALTVRKLTGMPVWASNDAGRLKDLDLTHIPASVTMVHLAVDKDANHKGEQACAKLAQRLIERGIMVVGHMVPSSYDDWNDMLLQAGANAAADAWEAASEVYEARPIDEPSGQAPEAEQTAERLVRGEGPGPDPNDTGADPSGADDPPGPDERIPVVWSGSEIVRLARTSIEILQASGEQIYSRNTSLWRPVGVRQKDKLVTQLRRIKAEYLTGALTQYTKWRKPKADGTLMPIDPPENVVNYILERVDAFAPISGIVNTPIMHADGSLLIQQGYDPHTHLLLVDLPKDMPDIPERPTKEQGAKAMEYVKKMFEEVPLAPDDDELPNRNAVSLATLVMIPFTILTRSSYSNCPGFYIFAPDSGTGKTHASLIACSVTGEAPSMFTPPTVWKQDEFEKQLGTKIMEGRSVQIIDNANRITIGGNTMCQATSAETISPRKLGVSEMPTCENNFVFITNGNNMRVGDDCVRRAVGVWLERPMERPSQHKYRRRDLLAKLRAKRGRTIAACFTALRHFIQAGMPEPEGARPLGGYEDHLKLVRNMLLYYGMADPVCGTEALCGEEPAKALLANVLDAWVAAFGEGPEHAKKAREVVMLTRDVSGETAYGGQSVYVPLAEVMRDMPYRVKTGFNEGNEQVWFGKWLGDHVRTVAPGGLRLNKVIEKQEAGKGNKSHRGNRYYVERITELKPEERNAGEDDDEYDPEDDHA
jgi:hypothetical protein